MSLRATYYDGRSAQPREVRLHALPGQVWFTGDGGVDRREPLDQVKLSEQLGSAPRMIRFRDGAHLEISDHEALAEWLDTVGVSERSVDLAQRSWAIALASIVLVLLAGYAGYRWGLPAAARIIAARVPPVVTGQLTKGTLEVLDRLLLAPSTLAPERQAQLEAGLRRLDPAGRSRLVFRAGPRVGANAMALPDGTLVLLDELVAVADHDEEILAVLAHELAHVERQHALRLMIESAAVGAFVAWWIGDYGAILTAAPAAILQARHSRELEAEADAEAASRLRGVGIAPARLADMLEKLEAAHGMGRPKPGLAQGGEEPEWLDYLSSHPATRARIAALRRL